MNQKQVELDKLRADALRYSRIKQMQDRAIKRWRQKNRDKMNSAHARAHAKAIKKFPLAFQSGVWLRGMVQRGLVKKPKTCDYCKRSGKISACIYNDVDILATLKWYCPSCDYLTKAERSRGRENQAYPEPICHKCKKMRKGQTRYFRVHVATSPLTWVCSDCRHR